MQHAVAKKPRAFLTGATGFLGRFVLSALAEQGIEAFSSTTQLDNVTQLRRELTDGPWCLIFHMAGLSLPSECEKNPALAYDVNLAGTIEFAKLCSEAQVEGPFVFFSSAYVYSPKLSGSIQETDLTSPAGVYGRSKFFAEQALADISKVAPFSVLALRLFNHSHKSQRADFFLPAMYQALKNGSLGASVEVPMGNPDLFRDFNSVQDFQMAISKIIEKRASVASDIRKSSQGFLAANLASGQTRRLGALVNVMAQKLGVGAVLKPIPDRMRPGEPETVCADTSVLERLVDFKISRRSDEEFVAQFLEDLK